MAVVMIEGTQSCLECYRMRMATSTLEKQLGTDECLPNRNIARLGRRQNPINISCLKREGKRDVKKEEKVASTDKNMCAPCIKAEKCSTECEELKKESKENKKDPCFPEKESNDCNIKKKDSKEKKKKKKTVYGKKVTMTEIKNSAADNCCKCCRALSSYFQELKKLVSGSGDEETKLADVLCEICEVSKGLGTDLYYFIRHIILCICCQKK